MAGFNPTDEQQRLLNHDPTRNARVLAGPGTGKSSTVIALAKALGEGRETGAVRLATFTRAATAELAQKAIEEGIPVPVTTVHGFALSLLQVNAQWSHLPSPIRIPDDWEHKNLINEDLRRRLATKWTGIKRRKVERLEREMASRWESMDQGFSLDQIDPDVRDAYIAAWRKQREVFGYSLFAEMPWYALEVVEDHAEAKLRKLQIFIVDEYQDLNACEIALIKALSKRGVIVIAVGDDDQSIYRWRMAAPTGIREFNVHFDALNYPLSVSHRCARRIVDASQRLIKSSPAHDRERPRLKASERNEEGEFSYVRYRSAQRERQAMSAKLKELHARGMDYNRMAVLFRSDYQSRWSNAIRAKLEESAIPYTDVEGALAPLSEKSSRWLLGIARLLINVSDDLAWWTLLQLEGGNSPEFRGLLADAAYEDGLRFSVRLRKLDKKPLDGATEASSRNALLVVHKIEQIIEGAKEFDLNDSSELWRKRLLDIASAEERVLSEPFQDLLSLSASYKEVDDEGLSTLINQLDNVARDQALKAPGVAVMTIARSKGLTFDAVLTMGVEQVMFPSPMAEDPEEDRRLLYVAITRARVVSILSMAKTRNDSTTRTGSGSFPSRSRVRFLSDAGITPIDRDVP